jgi:DDE domain
LSPTRDAQAAKRFFLKALHGPACSVPDARLLEEPVSQSTVSAHSITTPPTPRVINVEKNAASPKAIADLKATGILAERVELRQVKYLNTLIEQDHRFIKRLTKPGMGFFSFKMAWRTLQGYTIRNMLRKGQAQGVDKGEVRGQVALVATRFEVAVEEKGERTAPAQKVFFLFFATQPRLLVQVQETSCVRAEKNPLCSEKYAAQRQEESWLNELQYVDRSSYLLRSSL